MRAVRELKVAVDEGAPLVVHGAFALACLVLQRTMARNCPEGLLRRCRFRRSRCRSPSVDDDTRERRPGALCGVARYVRGPSPPRVSSEPRGGYEHHEGNK